MLPDNPFTNVIGIGVDIVEIARIQRIIERTGERFLRKVFTANERTYCASKRRPWESYAGRFAAKEAVLKAIGTGLTAGAALADVEILRTENGAPLVQLHHKTYLLAQERGIQHILLTLAHDGNQAIAIAMAVVITPEVPTNE